MKIMDKLKNLFTDEVEEEIVAEIKEPVKKETVKVDIPAPEPAIKKEEDPIKSENLSLKKEEKFVFPVYFDENDFDDFEKAEEPKPKKVEPPKFDDFKVNNSNNKEKPAQTQKPISEKKIFKPTPIISPVYGILDKNYYKEDIVVTTTTRSTYSSIGGPITVDDVRKKAFGTLEDDLEKTLFSSEPLTEEARHGKDDEDDSIFNEFDFANAVEEDKKRDLSKNDLKADIESLLNDKDFEDEFDYHINREDVDDSKKKAIKIEDEPTLEDDLTDDIQDDITYSEEEINDEKMDNEPLSLQDEEDEEIEDNDEIIPYEDDLEDKIEEEIVEEEDLEETEEETIPEEDTDEDEGIETENDDNNNDEELEDIISGELDMPSNTNINDNEIENAFADSSDLNDSDLFNLIDSMYDKEEE